VTARYDISFAVNKAAKYRENAQPADWKAVKRILRYLKPTSNFYAMEMKRVILLPMLTLFDQPQA
jgi:hypothetical protein